MSLKVELGRAVRLHRERVGLTQLALGEAIGRSLQTIGNIERGQSLPTLDTLEAIAGALKTPLREFFPRPGVAEDEVTQRIVARVASLSETERLWVDRVLGSMLDGPAARRR